MRSVAGVLGACLFAVACFSTSAPPPPPLVEPKPWSAGQGEPTSIQKWAAAMQPRPVVAFFDGLFTRVGVRVTDTSEAFTCVHAGDRILFSDELDPEAVDFVVEIDSAQVDRMLGYMTQGELDDVAQFRIMAAISTPATRAMLSRPIIRSEWLRSLLYWIGNAPERMQVVLAGPPGEPGVGHVIERVGGEVRVISGVQEGVTTLYRLTVGDAIEFQRRMIAARKANRFWTWISFARWYGVFTDRVAVPTS